MKRYNGGTEVRGGYYFKLGEWELTAVQGDKGILPGEPRQEFLRVPVLVLLVAAPMLGGLFAMFLPFLGFAMPVYAAAKRVRAHLSGRSTAEAGAA